MYHRLVAEVADTGKSYEWLDKLLVGFASDRTPGADNVSKDTA